MAEQPIPEQDPITGKSYAAHYVIATLILIVTLFWALWDEAWGQRPWKPLQEQWKGRYSAFLSSARSKSAASEKDVENNPQYAALKQAYEKAYQDSKPQAEAARKKLDDASARLLAVQSVFTDRRAYVNALTYELETSTSPSAKASKQKEIDSYKNEQATVEFPDGSKKKLTFPQLEETYNEIRDERTKLSLELGDVLKPVTAAKAKMDEYVSDHMVDLTPQQIDGLKKRATEWDPAIVQINVAEANIVDRCESCHMNAREPLKITAAAMTAKGEKKPDEYADGVCQPSGNGVADHSRSGEVWLLTLSSGQWPRDHQRREGARQLRALAVAALSQGKFRSRLPDLPRCRHGAGQRRRAVANHQQRQGPVPAKGLHGLPSL